MSVRIDDRGYVRVSLGSTRQYRAVVEFDTVDDAWRTLSRTVNELAVAEAAKNGERSDSPLAKLLEWLIYYTNKYASVEHEKLAEGTTTISTSKNQQMFVQEVLEWGERWLRRLHWYQL